MQITSLVVRGENGSNEVRIFIEPIYKIERDSVEKCEWSIRNFFIIKVN